LIDEIRRTNTFLIKFILILLLQLKKYLILLCKKTRNILLN
jgi:hypothetical protein